jgi:hypothetical protein
MHLSVALSSEQRSNSQFKKDAQFYRAVILVLEAKI